MALPDVLEHAFERQRQFILSTKKKKALFCSRRSAKSFTAGLHLVKTAQDYPGSNCLFVGLTRASAEAIIWKDILKHINDRYELGAVFNETKLKMTLPTGSEIIATGVDVDDNEMKKLLGRKFKLVCIDEASMYTISLDALIALIEPSMIDQQGTICLMGTASDFPRGIFYEITNGLHPDWELFKWSAHDNPYVAEHWQNKLNEIAQFRPLYMETPQFKQWYLNEWVVDQDKLVYKFDPNKNLIDVLPNRPYDGWSFVLGVDTGWEDDSAFVLTGYHTNDPYLYVISVYRRPKMTFNEVSDKILQYMADSYFAPHRVIIDGANKQGVESMKFRSSIPFEYADKQDKVTFIELCNSDLIQARIKILNTIQNKELCDEMTALIWQTDGDKIKYPKKEHPGLPNHMTDAFLYAWRCGYHYASTPAAANIVRYSAEWYQRSTENIWEQEKTQLIKENQSFDWPDDGNLGELGHF